MTSGGMTIKNKLTLLLMVVGCAAVLLSSLLFYSLVAKQFQTAYLRDLRNLADIVGQNCKVALLFNVPEDAQTVLSSLRSRHSVTQVSLYDSDGRLFSFYSPEPPDDGAPGLWGGFFDIHDQPVEIRQDIYLVDGTSVGYIVLKDDMRNVSKSKRQVLYILGAVAVVVLIATFFLSSFLQNIISVPLMTLTTLVRQLGTGNFDIEPNQFDKRHDEFGVLYDAFKEMSDKLKASYARLEDYSRTLEQRVYERTAELQKALRDLTQSQSQLVQSEKMAALGQLVAGIAHEINNNISFIAAVLPAIDRRPGELAAGGPEADRRKAAADIAEMLDNAEEGIRRTKKLISDLNTFCRPSHGRFSRTDIAEEIGSTLALLKYKLKNTITVDTDFPPGLPPVFCLRDELNQVFMNILLNAIYAINGSGRVRIAARREGKNIRVAFADSGPGVAREIMGKIFDPFFTTKPTGQGAGLGLSISYNIIKNHQGDITLSTANSELGGAEFIITLPVDGPEPTPLTEETAP